MLPRDWGCPSQLRMGSAVFAASFRNALEPHPCSQLQGEMGQGWHLEDGKTQGSSQEDVALEEVTGAG